MKSDINTALGVVAGIAVVGVALRLLNRKPKHVREINKAIRGYRKIGKNLIMMVASA